MKSSRYGHFIGSTLAEKNSYPPKTLQYQKTADKYPDLVLENDNSKGHRIGIGKASLNNVRTKWDVNNVCAQN